MNLQNTCSFPFFIQISKFIDYQEHGVLEYWIIDAQAETVEQYLLKNGKYELELEAKTGQIQSLAVAGFSITIPSIFNESENLKMLSKILKS